MSSGIEIHLSEQSHWQVSQTETSSFGKGWAAYFALLLFSLTLPTLKLPIVIDLRLAQLLLIMGFGVLGLRDLMNGTLRWGILLSLLGAGVMLCVISWVAPYTKFKQLVFFIKYLFLFPAAFYLGARIMLEMSAARIAVILELVLLAGCAMALLLEWYPITILIHERPEGLATGIKGSFWEQGEFAFFIGLMMLSSIALRMHSGEWPQRRWPLVLLYLLAIGCALASENRTIWLALILALMLGGLLYKDPAGPNGVAARWGPRIVAAGIFILILMWIYNSILPPAEKLISAELLTTKWETERGAALRIAAELIADKPWLGHGFGFVEAYFGTWAIGIVGLGAGVAQIFNSYIDLWVSVGIFGLIYGLGLIWYVLDRRVLFNCFVVTYLFVFANTNPVAQSEFYYLFLGAAYALSKWKRGTQFSVTTQPEVLKWSPITTPKPQ